MKISVIIPMYNEASIIEDTAKTLYEYMSGRFEDWELLFSDDGSSDGCGDLVRKLDLPNVRVVGYEKNHGKGCAVRTAMLEACGDIRMFTDADLAYGTEVIGRVYDTFAENTDADIVIGSRNISSDGYEGYTFIRKLASKCYMIVLRVVAGFKMSDSQCGFKVYTNDAAKKIFSEIETDGFAFDIEAIMTANSMGMSIGEMPVKIINHRESKINVLSDSIKMFRDLLRIKKRVKQRAKARNAKN